MKKDENFSQKTFTECCIFIIVNRVILCQALCIESVIYSKIASCVGDCHRDNIMIERAEILKWKMEASKWFPKYWVPTHLLLPHLGTLFEFGSRCHWGKRSIAKYESSAQCPTNFLALLDVLSIVFSICRHIVILSIMLQKNCFIIPLKSFVGFGVFNLRYYNAYDCYFSLNWSKNEGGCRSLS